MAATCGAAFRDDENLRVSERTFGKTRFIVGEDLTPEHNHTIVLLHARGHNELCVVLTTPPVTQLDAVKVNAAGVPEPFRTIDQPSPGYAAMEIRYRLGRDMIYAARRCTVVTWRGKHVARKQVTCLSM